MRALPIRGRAANDNPANRFAGIEVRVDPEADPEGEPAPRTRFFEDASRSVIAYNDSPDVGFDASVNPYRGCEVGCIYCYARTFHEFLGFSAGLDYETRILVKRDAPELLRRELASRRWKPKVIAMSGATDPYQPVERRLRITRECLEVLAEARNPVAIITKRDLVARDADLLAELAGARAASVRLSITSLDLALQRSMEPRSSSPARRLAAIRRLSLAGIPVGVNVAPVIPGLNDHEIPAILEAARDAGATSATFILVRLPYGVAELFDDWLERCWPERRARVMERIRGTRAGRLYDGRFSVRGRGEGEYAGQIRALFRATSVKLGLDLEPAPLSAAAFRPPRAGPQLGLFDAS